MSNHQKMNMIELMETYQAEYEEWTAREAEDHERNIALTKAEYAEKQARAKCNHNIAVSLVDSMIRLGADDTCDAKAIAQAFLDMAQRLDRIARREGRI
jgi:hypothetical protein